MVGKCAVTEIFLIFCIALFSATTSQKFPKTTNKARKATTVIAENTTADPPLADAVLPVVYQACCGSGENSCTTFDSLISMAGLECCGTKPVNFFNKICCNKKAHDRRVGNKYYDRCCGDTPHNFEKTCCNNTLTNGADLQCCGSQAYNIYDRTQMCCENQLHPIEAGMLSPACCGPFLYDAWANKQLCCGSQTYNRSEIDGCCVAQKAAAQTAPAAEGFNSQTHICCEKVFARSTHDACCYVNSSPQGEPKFPPDPPVPKAYNSTIECCSFDGITKKQKETCIL